jgi:hypothetical protein
MTLLVFLLLLPILWQLPRTFWPLHLDSTATRFTGLYRRYSIDTFTGHVSNVQTSADTQTIGSVTAHTSGMVIGGTYSGTTTVSDNRKTFKVDHTQFFLADQSGATQTVDAANVKPAIGNGHLVSAAWLVHNGKRGNAFLVYNHTTDSVYIEQTRRASKNAPRGLAKMVIRLPLAYQVVLWLLIVTWPLIILIAAGAELQLRWFRKHAAKPLARALARRAVPAP